MLKQNRTRTLSSFFIYASSKSPNDLFRMGSFTVIRFGCGRGCAMNSMVKYISFGHTPEHLRVPCVFARDKGPLRPPAAHKCSCGWCISWFPYPIRWNSETSALICENHGFLYPTADRPAKEICGKEKRFLVVGYDNLCRFSGDTGVLLPFDEQPL